MVSGLKKKTEKIVLGISPWNVEPMLKKYIVILLILKTFFDIPEIPVVVQGCATEFFY